METALGERRSRGQQNSPGTGGEVVFPEEPLKGRGGVGSGRADGRGSLGPRCGVRIRLRLRGCLVTSSESQGVTNAEQELTAAVSNCPNQKEVLLGYSQGAEVSMDVIAGNSETGGTVTPVSTAISSHVAAIANFGDPGHVVGQSWDLGTARRAGLFPRSSAQLRLLTAFGGSGKIAAWCDSNDPYCASGINLEVHLTYLNRYQSAAASFVLSKIGG